MRQLRYFIQKELLLLSRDLHGLLLLFVMPAIFILIMTFALQSQYDNSGHLNEPLTAPQLEALQLTLPFNHNQRRLELQIDNDSDILLVLEKLNQQQLSIGRIHYGARNLEELFLNLTQRSLRD